MFKIMAFSVLFISSFSGLASAQSLESTQITTARGTIVNIEITVPDGLTATAPVVVLAPGQGYHMDLPILKELADRLSASGILVYRFNWSYFSSTPQGQPSDDLSNEVQDMLALVNLAKADPRADATRLVLAGKSLGSLVAYQVFAKDFSVKALALLTPICTSNYDDQGKQLAAPIAVGAENYLGLTAWNKPIVMAVGNEDPNCSLPMLYDLLKNTRGNFSTVEVGGDHSWNLSQASDADSLQRNAENVESGVAAVAHWINVFLYPSTILQPANDQDWNSLAAELQSKTSNDDLVSTLNDRLPSLLEAIRADSNNLIYKNLWGQSINFDELAKGIIVAPAILDVLLGEFKAAPRVGRYSHAGLEHTFGYLFSSLQTAYGFKRARWITPDIESGLALPAGIMGPFPAEGTLFSNVSYLASHIAFRFQPDILAAVEQHSESVAMEVKNLPYANLKIRRLEESLSSPSTVKIHTDIVEFTNAPITQSNQYLLVYSVDDHLITAFPVAKSFVDSLFNPSVIGENVLIQTKYNAYVPGITDSPTPLMGSRLETLGN